MFMLDRNQRACWVVDGFCARSSHLCQQKRSHHAAHEVKTKRDSTMGSRVVRKPVVVGCITGGVAIGIGMHLLSKAQFTSIHACNFMNKRRCTLVHRPCSGSCVQAFQTSLADFASVLRYLIGKSTAS